MDPTRSLGHHIVNGHAAELPGLIFFKRSIQNRHTKVGYKTDSIGPSQLSRSKLRGCLNSRRLPRACEIGA